MIPPDGLVIEAIKRSLLSGRIHSANQLAMQVEARLAEKCERYTVTPRRAKRLASKIPSVRITVVTRRSGRLLAACPICEVEMEPLRARSLTGGETVAGRRCPICGFQIGVRPS